MRENKYVAIKVKGKRIDEHRYVWEKHYGEIPEGYVIHHINGIKYDNRIENLEIMTLEEHSRLHSKKLTDWIKENPEARIEGQRKSGESKRITGKEGFSWCTRGKHFEEDNKFSKNRTTWNGLESMCKECRKLYRNNRNEKI